MLRSATQFVKSFCTQGRSSSQLHVTKTHLSTSNRQSEDSFPGFPPEVIAPSCANVGPGAKKDGCYENPEYFCYHLYSYYELHVLMSKERLPQPVSRPPKKYETDDTNEGGESCQ